MSRKIPSIFVMLLFCLACASCAEESFGKALPRDAFQFPVGLAVHHEGYALVASSNFNLAHVKGAIRVIDLNKLAAELDLDMSDRDDHPYYRGVILQDTSIGIDNFAGAVTLSSDGRLAMVSIRETDELLLLDVDVLFDDGGQARLELSCWPGGWELRPDDDFPECTDARHRIDLAMLAEQAEFDDLRDPFEIILIESPENGGSRTALVSFLRSGDVAALDIPASDDEDAYPGLLYRFKTGVDGTSDLARAPATGLVYVTSRYPDLQKNPIHFFDPALGEDAEVETVDFFEDFLGNETRSITFAADGTTAGLLVLNPDMLVLMDTTPDCTGKPANRLLGMVPLGSNPSRVRAFGDYMFVTGAKDDAVYAIDTRTRRLVAIREDICRGPFEIDFWDREDLKWGLISCFEDDTIAVLDVDPDSPDFLEVIARVGKPREGE